MSLAPTWSSVSVYTGSSLYKAVVFRFRLFSLLWTFSCIHITLEVVYPNKALFADATNRPSACNSDKLSNLHDTILHKDRARVGFAVNSNFSSSTKTTLSRRAFFGSENERCLIRNKIQNISQRHAESAFNHTQTVLIFLSSWNIASMKRTLPDKRINRTRNVTHEHAKVLHTWFDAYELAQIQRHGQNMSW